MLQLKELGDALDEIEIEPRNESKILRIKKALEADYRKNISEYIDKDELNLLKAYFEDIINGSNLTISDIINILSNYQDDSTSQPFIDLIENIKTDLTTKKLKINKFLEFIQKFVQQNYPINVFYRKYYPALTKPTLTDIFGDELEDLSSTTTGTSSNSSSSGYTTTSDSEEKLQRIRDKIEENTKVPRTLKLIQPHEKGKVETIQNEIPILKPRLPAPKPIADKIFFETMVNLTKQDCEFLYRKIPWVKDIINRVYVHPVEGDFDDILDYTRFIEHDNLKFYQPKEKYYGLQCGTHKIQEGTLLTIIKNKKTYKLMVAIDTNTKGIVLQNEDMLKAEVDYIRVWTQNKGEHIKELKKNKPNDDMVQLAKFTLSNSLQDAIGGNVPVIYRSNNSQFINIVVQTILKKSKTGEAFVRLLANLTIFLNISLSFVSSSVFIKRLREQIYLPGTLPFLTDADKLPEIFMSKNVPEDTKNFVLEKLEEERLKFTKNFFDLLHGSNAIRHPTKPTLWNKPTQQIELPDIKSICKNKDDIMDENDENIVFYTDMSEVYCFNVYKLYDLFKQEEIPLNPYTNRPFSDKFIQTFLTRYASKPLVNRLEHTHRVELTTYLEQLVEQELSMLENKLIEIENPEFIQKLKNSAEFEPIKRVSENKVNTEPDKCMECRGDLGSEKIGSVFRNKPVAFCSYSCLGKNKAFK